MNKDTPLELIELQNYLISRLVDDINSLNEKLTKVQDDLNSLQEKFDNANILRNRINTGFKGLDYYLKKYNSFKGE